MGPQKSLQFQPKWRFLALKLETFCYYNCFYPFVLRLTVILAKKFEKLGHFNQNGCGFGRNWLYIGKMHAFQLDWVKNATVLKLKNYRPRVSKKTQKNSPQ